MFITWAWPRRNFIRGGKWGSLALNTEIKLHGKTKSIFRPLPKKTFTRNEIIQEPLKILLRFKNAEKVAVGKKVQWLIKIFRVLDKTKRDDIIITFS